MSLLTPAFLAGLGLLLVPIIIHLTQRQRSKVTVFPSLMFLRKLPFKTTERRRIRHPLLFALRCLAIALLALAFARPFFEQARSAGGDEARDVVLLVDTSASLGYEDRWTAALDSARAAVAGLTEVDRVSLVAYAEQAVQRLALTENREALSRALDGLEVTDRGTRLDAGLRLASRILNESERQQREVVLITDFQRTGWEEGGRVRLPDGVQLRTVPVGETEAANVAVTGASIQTTEASRVRVLGRLTNMGSDAVEDLEVSLDLGGRIVATQRVNVEPRGAATVSFDDIAMPDGARRGGLSIPGDGLSIDDQLRFVADADEGLQALIIQSNRGRSDRSLFLERALAVGDAPRIRSSTGTAVRLEAANLNPASLVIVNDGDLSDAGRAGRLRDWVAAGGGLVIALGPNAAPDRWSDAGTALLGGTATEIAQNLSGQRVSWLDYDHPVFELFSAPRSGDFSEARFLRSWAFEPGPETSVIARFDGGGPALLEHSVGEGRVLVWTSSLDRFWNDLALQPVFVPFVHRLAMHATRHRDPERWIETGGVIELAAATGDETGARDWVLVNPAGDRDPIEREEGPTWIEFPSTGFYQIESLDGDVTVSVAVNLPVGESDLTAVAPERVVETVLGVVDPDVVAASAAVEEAEPQRAELWWPLVVLATLALMVESVIANRWTRRRPASTLSGAGS